MWEIKNILLLVAGVINLLMSLFVISRGWKNKINLYFSLLTFFNFTWSLGLFISRFVSDLNITGIFARSTYISALLIAISLYYFVLYFPYKIQNLKIGKKILIWIPFVFFVFIIYSDLFIVEFITADVENEYISIFRMPYVLFYVLYFLTISFIAINMLVRKYLKAENIFKKQIKLLLLSIIIGLALGSFFDLFLLLYGNFDYNWLGPIFTVLMNGVVFYIIKSSKK